MDGSCNGLQHYAALGRDEAGGQAVNVIPIASQSQSQLQSDSESESESDDFVSNATLKEAKENNNNANNKNDNNEKPQDVYTGVLRLVLKEIDREVAQELSPDAGEREKKKS
jgi:DNA-directed RNA polymerase